MVARAKLDLALQGTSEGDIQNHEKRLIEQLRPQAEQRVRIYLFLEAVAKKENIPLNEQMPSRTMEFLLREASWIKEP
jgi:FKBP-type peptidyl-prolyl cis-trans isomerase (trigger factor)